MERTLALARIDVDSAANLLAIAAEAIAARGDADLVGVLRLVREILERVADGLENQPTQEGTR